MKNKRFTASFSFYIWAESDEEAIEKAKKFALMQRQKFDNQCNLEEVSRTPFASFESIPIYQSQN